MLLSGARRLLLPSGRRASSTSSTSALQYRPKESLVQRMSFNASLRSRDEHRKLSLAALGSLASPEARVARLLALRRTYSVLEGALDEEAAAEGAAADADGLSEFSSLYGAAGAFWRAHAEGLRRLPAIQRALDADKGPSLFPDMKLDDDQRLWEPAQKQYARRVAAAATLNGDLLLGHVFAAHVVANLDLELTVRLPLGARVDFFDAERRLGFASTCNPTPTKAEAALAAIEQCAEELDDDVQTAIAAEATRALELHRSVFVAGAGWRNAGVAGAKLALARVAEQMRPTPPDAAEAETRKV